MKSNKRSLQPGSIHFSAEELIKLVLAVAILFAAYRGDGLDELREILWLM